MADIIQLRRDSAADWTSADPTLANGEVGLETDTGKFKTGDGVTAWTGLSYFTLDDLEDITDVVITAPGDNEVLAYNSGNATWINQTPAEAGLAADVHTHLEADITDLGSYLPLTAGAGEALTGDLYIETATFPALRLAKDGSGARYTAIHDDTANAKLRKVSWGAEAILNLQAYDGQGTAGATIRCFADGTTTGVAKFDVCVMDETTNVQHSLIATDDNGDAELVKRGGDLKVGGITFMPDSALAVTGLWNFQASGVGGFTDYDMTIGDVTTPDYGMLRIGQSVFGRTSRVNANLDLDGTVVLINRDTPPTSNILFAMMDGSNSMRFALPKAAVGNATYNPRSMLHAGPAPNDDECVTVGYWQTQGIFHNLACDTSGSGADLGVQNDLEVEGDIYTDSIKESTTAAGVTIDGLLIKDGGIPDGSDSTAIHDNVAGEINAIADKATHHGDDWIIIEDSEASWAKKHINLGTVGGVYALTFNGSTYGQVNTSVSSGRTSKEVEIFGDSPLWNANQMTIEVSNDSGSAMSAGDLCYISGDSSGVPQVTLADADAEASCSKMLVLIIDSISNGSDGTALIKGQWTTTGLTASSVYFASTTAGDFTTTAPSGTGDIVRIIGYALSTTKLYFDPDKTFVEISA
jgi:hypothetical protein